MTERYSEAYDIYLDIIKVRPKNAPRRGTAIDPGSARLTTQPR